MQFMSPFSPSAQIPTDAQIVFVADMFASDYEGGAELTTEALIASSPYKVHRVKSREVTIELLRAGADKHWIFGNFAELNGQLIPAIVANLRYSMLEYDYKCCKHRSFELHQHAEGKSCDCHEQQVGKLVSAFMHGAKSLWFMSEAQMRRYTSRYPFLQKPTTTVLSSVFSDETLDRLRELRLNDDHRGSQWAMLGSPSWIKGAQAANDWCKANASAHVVLWNMPYANVLRSLRASKGFVYLPEGGDTCPRMVIEAKLLGCELVINDNVQHAKEEWFATDDLDAIDEYLRGAKTTFWNGIKDAIERRPSISGYVTTYNCVQQEYPFEECIRSLKAFCGEVCVVDGGSKDETLERLVRLARPEASSYDVDTCVDRLMLGEEELHGNGIRIKVVKRDWRDPRFALFDGMQKAEARKMCKGDFCWQMDSDEVVHEQDAPKIVGLCERFPIDADVVSLPVIEYWSGPEKVRMDVNPWKWRLSRNLPHITHGVPVSHRRYDEQGRLYAAPGTDGCDMIHVETGESLPHASFFTKEAFELQQAALSGRSVSQTLYERWFNDVIAVLPGVHHYSWFDLQRKIRLYRDYWTSHWCSIEGRQYVDTAETNMMFDVPWSQVTDEMIDARAAELREIGGWIWHRKWDGTKTPWMTVKRSEPKVMTPRKKEYTT